MGRLKKNFPLCENNFLDEEPFANELILFVEKNLHKLPKYVVQLVEGWNSFRSRNLSTLFRIPLNDDRVEAYELKNFQIGDKG